MELVLIGRKPLATAAFLSGQGLDRLVIDAQDMSFACPLDLAGIVATAHWASGCGFRVILRLPSDSDTAAYLQRMDLLRQMPPRTQILGPVPRDVRTDRRGTLMEVTALNEKNVNDLAERLGRLVTSSYRAHSATAGAAVFRACSELMSNATEHGSSAQGAFIAVQLYSGSTSETPRLEFAVCDTGIGVMQHLRRNPKHSHLTRDDLAIKKALKPGVSGLGDQRGNGLSDAIEHTRHYGEVDLQIRSGRGEVLVVGTPTLHHVRPQGRLDETSGTWAWLTHRWPSDDQTVLHSKK